MNIQFISDRGKTLSAYAYYGADEYDDDMPAGWYDEGTDELADYTFENGEAFMVNAGTACNFVYNGQVNMLETYVPARRLLSVQGNIRPCSVDIQSIIPVDSDEDGEYIGDGDVNIQFISDRGKTLTAYAYYGADEYDDDMPAGWYDEGTDELAEYTFSAGEGFMVNAAAACYLKFPAL